MSNARITVAAPSLSNDRAATGAKRRLMPRWMSVFAVLAAVASAHCSGEAGAPTVEDSTPGEGTAAPADPAQGTDVAPSAPQGSVPDTAAPAIVSITPADGAKGVRADAKLVVKFSEAMSPAATEAAFSSKSFSPAAVTFAWDAAGTELTITPVNKLSYDVGLDAANPANKYAFSIGTGATDLAGNPLAAQGSSVFTTLREIFMAAPLVPASSGSLSDGLVPVATANPGTWSTGDTSKNKAVSLFFTFDLAALPEGAEVTEARFATRQLSIQNTPFDDLGGHADLGRVSFGTFDGATLKASVATDNATLSASAVAGSRTLDVTAAVTDDVAKRIVQGNKSQFRLGFASTTDGKFDIDRASFLAPELGLAYLIP